MRDANGHRFWSIGETAVLDLGPGELAWTQGGCLSLAGRLEGLVSEAPRSAALALADLPAVTVDGFSTWAYVDRAAGRLVAAGAGGGPARIMDLPAGTAVHDLAVDGAGVLRLAGRLPDAAGEIFDGVALVDLRGRWSTPVLLAPSGGAPDRVAAAGGVAWALDRATGALWREAGQPLHDLAVRTRRPGSFQPDPPYPFGARLEEQAPIAIEGNERIACMAVRDDGLLAVLVHSTHQARRAHVVFVTPDDARSTVEVPVRGFPSSLGWLAADQLALLFPDVARAAVFTTSPVLPAAMIASPRRHPLQGATRFRFARTSVLPAAYVGYDGEQPLPPRPTAALSLAGYRDRGTASLALPIDAGERGHVWHRLVVEGDFPPGTGARIELRAADTTTALAEEVFAGHGFGSPPGGDGDEARGGWIKEPSEFPFDEGRLGVPPVPERTGCFVALVQRPGRQAREVAGRFLEARITLYGQGQTAPRLAAIRVWGGRFSLVRRYLPPVFHAASDADDRARLGPAQPNDFLERYVLTFESVLTRLEDKVASAHLLTNPLTAPEPALAWLAGWIGSLPAPGLTTSARRRMIANAMRLHRQRGTLGGLLLALDVASEGGVARGGIVALEDFSLRRVFATILGADLGSRFDPLLAGPVQSGNSFVGPTLVLGEAAVGEPGQPKLSAAQEAELAALLEAPSLTDAEAVRGFMDALANRVTVLVHQAADARQLSVIREVAAEMTPAHVALRVERATASLVIGLYALLDIDTYLRPRPGPDPIRLDHSVLGGKDVVLRLPALDPRLEQGARP
ncbi:MAG: hypothetical protein EA356_12825 [Geminicoccaceae bacterium]|nr:MAG: hypothetical protein EA356_12825 [Geminicoccaceae bacterium]